KLICRFITMAPFRELPATTASAASAMTAETDKSAFPYQHEYKKDRFIQTTHSKDGTLPPF
ncbi:hypothetical protein, partial [Ralstonia solanacearum]|uniref:hypothetical protein n=1 Tax=Ralstonia solanacearum TaxID=305 RepID=UPI003DA39DCD